MSGRQMFEHADEDKFWEIWADGTTVYTRFGKRGANGQTRLKDEGAAAAATAAIAKQIREKAAAGYVQVGGAPAVTAPALDGKELKRHLKNLPPLVDDPAYLVFADWLQTHNHPWGEQIALQHGAATNAKKAASLQKQADKHLKQNGLAILGPLANAKYSHFTWHLGFLRRAVVGCEASTAAILKAAKGLLALPLAHMLEGLSLSPVPDTFNTTRDWSTSIRNLVDPWGDLAKLAAVIPERVTRVGFGGWPAPAAAAYVQMPSFTKLSTAFPKLRALELTGWCGDKPGKLALSQLVELDVRFARATDAALQALAASKLPKLERLAVSLGGTSNALLDDVYPPDEYDEDDEDASRYPDTYSAEDLEEMEEHGLSMDATPAGFRELLSGSFAPALARLALHSSAYRPELCTAIARGALVKRLTRLELSGAPISDDAAQVLIANKKSLAALELRAYRYSKGSDAITPGVAKKLAAALPNATLIELDQTQYYAAPFHMRYVATME